MRGAAGRFSRVGIESSDGRSAVISVTSRQPRRMLSWRRREAGAPAEAPRDVVMADDATRIEQLEAALRQREAELREARAEIDTLRQREVAFVGEVQSRDHALAACVWRRIMSEASDSTSIPSTGE